MTSEQIRDLLGFSLGATLPLSEIAQIEAKIMKNLSSRTEPDRDSLLHECQTTAAVYSYLNKTKRTLEKPFLLPSESTAKLLYLKILELDRMDQFLLLAHYRHHVPLTVLELVLKQPAASLEFRCQHLLNWLYENIDVNTIPKAQFPDFLQSLNWRVFMKEDGRLDTPTSAAVRWKKVPTPVRIASEIGMVAAVLFSLLWMFPKIRNVYERSSQDQINAYLIEKSLVDSPVPASLSQAPVVTQNPPDEPEITEPETIEPDVTRKQPKVRGGETWRFSFAGTGFTDLDAQVQTIIKKNTQNEVKSSVVPGGIQLELLLSLSEVIPMKQAFEQLATQLNRKAAQKQNVENSEEPNTNVMNLSWYKKRSPTTRKIDANQVLVYVWISTL